MQKHAKYLKGIFSNKGKLVDLATIGLNKKCFAIFLRKFPPKLSDPRSFSIPCTIGNLGIDSALCDLGANINLMSYSIDKKLALQQPQPTNIYLLLAEQERERYRKRGSKGSFQGVLWTLACPG